MKIVRPSNSHKYQEIIEHSRAIEPPIWHIILADYLKADEVIDFEVEDRYVPKDSYILDTGNNPTGFKSKLPMNPIEYKPRWEMIDLAKYRAHDWHAGSEPRSPYGVVYTSIACPFKCSFCFSNDFYPVGYTKRPVDDVIEDFRYLGSKGVRHIKIMDELFALDKNRVKEICGRIADLGYDFNIWCYARIDTTKKDMLVDMKRAGINWVAYGIESGNQGIRESISKGRFSNDDIENVVKMTRDAGIKVGGNFIFGFENDTMETMKETYDFAEKLRCEYANFYCLIDKDANQLSEGFIPKATRTLSPQEVLKFRDDAYCKYYKTDVRLRRTNETS